MPAPNSLSHDAAGASRRRSAPSRRAAPSTTHACPAKLPMPKKTIVVQIQRLPAELVPALAQLAQERLRLDDVVARRDAHARAGAPRPPRSSRVDRSAPPGLPARRARRRAPGAPNAEDRAAEPEQRVRLLQPHRADDRRDQPVLTSGSRSRRRARRRRASTASDQHASRGRSTSSVAGDRLHDAPARRRRRRARGGAAGGRPSTPAATRDRGAAACRRRARCRPRSASCA